MRRVFFFSIVAIVLLVTIPAFAQQEFYQVTTTAYCSCQKCCGKAPSHKAYGVTKSGIRLSDNPFVAAAHPELFPQGSIIFIENTGYRLVGDTGAFMHWKGGKWVVDVYMEDHQAALRYGRRVVGVVLVRRGWDEWTHANVRSYFDDGKYSRSADTLGVSRGIERPELPPEIDLPEVEEVKVDDSKRELVSLFATVIILAAFVLCFGHYFEEEFRHDKRRTTSR